MTSAIDRLNDWLYKAAPGDLQFFIRYPPNLDDFAVTADDLLHKLKAAPLPDVPPEPPPVTPPVPTIPIDTLVVNASAGLSIRAQPSTTAAKIGALQNGDIVEVQDNTANGTYHFAQLLRVNGLKYAAVGFVARGKIDGSETYLVKA